MPSAGSVSSADVTTEQAAQGEELARLHAELAQLKLENLELRSIIDSIVNAVSRYR